MKYAKTAIVYLALWVLALCSAAQAGNSSSGGGEVFGDMLNPWFLENTSTVSYCIEVDPKNFAQLSLPLNSLVESALNQWKSAFAHARPGTPTLPSLEPFGMVRIATQAFIREDCGPTTLLRLQFGVLTPEQRREHIQNPTQIVAETVRTSYDRKNLRGQGFIYIAPESGPLRPKDLNMAEHPWSFRDGVILKRVLMHELGHLFGLSHSGNAYALMGQAQPEFIVQKSTIERMSKEPPGPVEKALSKIGLFGFEFPHEQEICERGISIGIEPFPQDRFFGFTANLKCHKFVFLSDSIQVFAAPAGGLPYTLIGTTLLAAPLEQSQPLIRIQISKEQQVFTQIPVRAQATGYLEGPSVATRKVFTSVYQSVDGQKSGAIKTTLLPNQLIEMDAILDGKFVQVFDHGG